MFLDRLAANIASNSQKANATQIELTFSQTPGRKLMLHIDDNGYGFDENDPHNPIVEGFKHGHSRWRDRSGTGFGMAELEDAAKHLGVEMMASKSPTSGARITLMFPL